MMAASPEPKGTPGGKSSNESGRSSNEKAAAAQRRSRYVRDPGAAPVLTPDRLRLLETVAAYRLVSLPQLVRLGGRSPKATQRAMRALFDAGLVDVVAAPRAALAEPGDANGTSLLFGSAPNIYRPARAGIRLLQAHGLSDGRRPVPAYGPQNALLLRHELGVRDVRIWLELTARRHPGQALARWCDGPEAAIALGRTQPPKEARPDAWFVYRLGQREGHAAVLVGLLELDRATERGPRRWAEKLAAYQALLTGPRLREVTGYVNARVLVVCPSAGRRAHLAAQIARLAPPPVAECFWLTERRALERAGLGASVWQRPGSQLLRALVPGGGLGTAP